MDVNTNHKAYCKIKVFEIANIKYRRHRGE